MAFSAMKLSLFILLTLFSLHSHARDSQFFNKVPSTTNTNDVALPHNKQSLDNEQQQQQDPAFLPEKENAYGLFGHESGLNPPSTAASTTPAAEEFKQPVHKYLPKNYNPVAYVTQPEDINETTSFSEETNNPNNNGNHYYYNNNNQQEEEEKTEFRNYPASTTTNRPNANYYLNGGSSFNSGAAKYRGGAAGRNGYQPQGMSDTRFLENGKYFYDINAEKYSNNHPYESLKDVRSGVRTSNEYNYNKNFYGNGENNGYEFNQENFNGGYQNQNQEDEFLDEESLP